MPLPGIRLPTAHSPLIMQPACRARACRTLMTPRRCTRTSWPATPTAWRCAAPRLRSFFLFHVRGLHFNPCTPGSEHAPSYGRVVQAGLEGGVAQAELAPALRACAVCGV